MRQPSFHSVAWYQPGLGLKVEFIDPHPTNLICAHQEKNSELERNPHCPRQAHGLDVSVLIRREHWGFDDRTPELLQFSVGKHSRARLRCSNDAEAGGRVKRDQVIIFGYAKCERLSDHRLGLDRLRRDTFIHHIAEQLLDCGALNFLDWETMEFGFEIAPIGPLFTGDRSLAFLLLLGLPVALSASVDVRLE